MKRTIAVVVILLAILSLSAQTVYKPYILADTNKDSVVARLTTQGFDIVGKYIVDDTTEVLVVTCETLKKIAGESEKGGFGVLMRIATSGNIVSYTNPAYWAFAYRLKSDLKDVSVKLENALGNQGEFGAKEGFTEKKLRKYHYMMAMPHFDDPVEVGTFESYKEAVQIIENNLKAEKGGLGIIAKVVIPGKDETLFSIKITGEHDGADAIAMKTLNGFTGKPYNTAYLPYELLVSGNKAYILHGKFRIAVSFPDLSMGQFMKIRGAPGDIKDAAKKVCVK